MSNGVRARASAVREPACRVSAEQGAYRLGAVALASVLVFGAPMPAGAQQVSPPELTDHVEPDAPTNAFNLPLEGWVKVRYSVLANGTTADVRVVEVVPPRIDADDVVAAVEKWKFEPATVDGEAVDWHNNESVVVFDAETVPLEPTPAFAQSYVEIAELIEAMDYDKARKQNEALLENRTTRLAEIGLAETQAAILNIGASNMHGAYDAIRRATDPAVVTLTDSELVSALRYRFGIEIELGHYARSLETYDRIAALEPPSEGDVVKTNADAVRKALQTDAIVPVKGRVEREPWSYAPTRRTFGFTDVEGSIRSLQLECNRRKTELEYSADVEWSIPETWGACTVFVDAKRDTTFTLVEFPAQAAAE